MYGRPNGGKSGKKGFYMGRKLKDKEYVSSPGPANYDPKFNAGKKNDPSYRLGGEQRGKDLNSSKNVPGPGAYNSNDPKISKLKGGAISICGRRPDKDN